jgi:hypothetical protein
VLDALVMVGIRLTGGRLAELFFGVGYDGTAQICTSADQVIWRTGDEWLKAPAHIHVRLRVWSKGGPVTTILDLGVDRIRPGLTLELDTMGPYVVDPSKPPINLGFTLRPQLKGTALPYSVGDKIPFDLQMSRDWVKRGVLILEAERSKGA